MNDLVSRQALLDEFEQWQKIDGYSNGEWNLLVDVLDVIKSMPPASQLSTNLASLGTDCISRHAAIEALRDYLVGKRCPDDGTLTCRLIENEVINKLLPIQPKRGRWLEDKGQQTLMKNFIERGEVWRVCSVCGAGHMIGHKYAIDKAYHDRHHNFCPNCGCRMDGGE